MASRSSNGIELKITLPKIPDIELVALEGLERLARHLGIADEKIGEAKILVTEAIINAFEHAGAKNSAVRVEFTMTPENLVIFVRDYGMGFVPSEVGDPAAVRRTRGEPKRGWGIKLMKSLSDDFRIESNRKGTRITITKLLT
jgi:anti-sigma regulatory factor (Ser/Thr protein kinase)